MKCYSWIDTNWVKFGKDINGEAAEDLLGLSISLSSDGSILAAGATGNDGSGVDAGHVRVYSLPVLAITTQPQSKTIQAGSNAQLIVGANLAAANFQWQRNTGSGWSNLSNGGQFSGVTNDTLTISNITLNNKNQLFRCVVSKDAYSYNSDSAILYVVPAYLPTNGLVGWWPFNGNAKDESGNGNDGRAIGAVLSADRNDELNKSYYLNGSTDFIKYNLKSILNKLPSNGEITTSIWVKTIDEHGPLISMQGQGGVDYDFHIGTLADIVQSPKKYGILLRDGNTCCGTGNNLFGGEASDNKWHHLAIVRSTNGTLKLYKNGFLENTSDAKQSGPMTFDSSYMAFGAQLAWIEGAKGSCGSCNSENQRYLKGNLDDAAIWNRALSASEIAALYSANSCGLAISRQPANQSITVGTNAQFSLSTGPIDATYQWQRNTGSGWSNLSNGGQFSGATNDTLTISNITQSNKNQRFRCVINKDTCNIFSDSVSLMVYMPLNPIKWNEVTTVREHYLRIVKHNNNLFFAASGNITGVGNASTYDLYSSSNLINWQPVNYKLPSYAGLAFNKDKDNILFLATQHKGVYKSSDSGKTWAYANVGNGYGCMALDFEIDSDNNYYTGIGGFLRGLHISQDNGTNWSNKISSKDFSDIHFIPSYKKIFAINTNNEVFVSKDSGKTWQQISGEPFSNSAILTKNIDSRILIFTNNGKIYSSTNGGSNWNLYSYLNFSGTAVPYFNDAIFISAKNWMVGIHKKGLWESNDSGQNWTIRDSGLLGDFHYFFRDKNTTLVTTSLGIFKLEGICASISRQPANQSKTVGTNARFSLSAGPSSATYQWQRNTGSGWSNLSNGIAFSGVTNDTLSISSLPRSFDGHLFRCIVSADTCRDTSAVVTLSVDCGLISAEPVNKIIFKESNTLFDLTASPVSSFQWQRNTGSGWSNLSNSSTFNGVTNDTLSITAAPLSANGDQFRCIVSADGCADTSVTVTLNVSACASGTVTWDGGGADQSAFTKENMDVDMLPCPTANARFNGTSDKNCVIGDTLELADLTATKAYKGRIKVEGKNTIINADDIDLQGTMFSVEARCGKITCDSFTVSDNSYAECSESGMDASSLIIGNGTFVARSKATLNLERYSLNRFSLGRNGMFRSPAGTGVVSCNGNFSRHAVSTFDPRDGLWRFTGDQNSSMDFGVGTNNRARISFHNLTIAKTNSNTVTITNNDTLQVNGNFILSGTNSRVQGGILNAKGNITMGNAFSDGAFDRVLLTGTANQTITCDNAAEFSETVVINKASGKVLLGKDLSLGSVRFNIGILDPNGKKFILTGNDISGQNIQSNIKDRAYVLKTNGAFSGNSITVPLSKGDGLSLNSISLNTSGTHNDWQLDYVAANPNTIDGDLNSDLASISSTGYWRVQRLSSGAGSAETFLKILAGSGFDRVALLDGGAWRSIGGSVSGSSITSTESSLFASTGDWYITAGVAAAPTAVNQVIVDKDVISGEELELSNWSPNGVEGRSPSGVEGSNNGIKVYPNPAHEFLNIQLPEGAVRYTISDLSGRVLSTHSASQTKLNLNKLSEGMYLLSTEVNGLKYSVRFVKGD